VNFKPAVSVEPSNRDARFVLASFYLVNKRYAKAEEAYQALAQLDKDKPEGRSCLGDFYGATGRVDEAIAIYKEVVANAPDYTQGRYRLGRTALESGQPEGSLRHHRRDPEKGCDRSTGDDPARASSCRPATPSA
jgi:tetratricopeptide (TPR) repeat protein